MEWWTEGVYATEILLWAIVFVFMWWYYKNFKFQISNFKFRMTKDRIFVSAVLLFVIYCFVSRFWSLDSDLAMQQSLRILEAFLLFFVLWLGPLKKEDAIKWLVLGSILPCILGIWQFLMQSTFASKWLGLALHPAWQAGTSVVASDAIGRWLRAYGTFSHPNVFGGFLVIVLVCLIMNNGTWIMEQKKSLCFVFHVLCSMFCVALFFTFSRSAWIVAFIGLLVYWFIVWRQRLKDYKIKRLPVTSHQLLIIVYLVILVVLFFPLIQTRLTSLSVTEMRSTDERVSEYSDAWKLFKKDPILGVGAGNYTKALWESNKWRPAWKIQPVHNAFVLFAVESGVVGVGLLAFVVLTWIMDQRSWIKRRGQFDVCSMFHVLCFVIIVSFDHYLYSSYTGLMLSALFFGLISRKSDDKAISPQLIHF